MGDGWEYVETLILIGITVWMTLYLVVEIFTIWRERPPVRWDPYRMRWVANRGKRRQRYIPNRSKSHARQQEPHHRQYAAHRCHHQPRTQPPRRTPV